MEECWWKELQPLRIPGIWTVQWQKLEDVEPEQLNPDDDRWLFVFVEDMMYLTTHFKRKVNKKVEQQELAIDLGWYPDGDPSGQFCLLAILNNNWEFPLLQFCSRSKKEVVEVMEYWLFKIFSWTHFIEEDSFRIYHQNWQKDCPFL